MPLAFRRHWPGLAALKVRCLHTLVREKLAFLLLVVAFLAAVGFLPPAAPRQISTLPRKDVAQIAQAVRREMRREILPDVSLKSIRGLASSLQRYWSEQILSIDVRPDGTVMVTTGRKTKDGQWDFYGNTYELKAGPKGWLITGRGDWISNSETAPNRQISVIGAFGGFYALVRRAAA